MKNEKHFYVLICSHSYHRSGHSFNVLNYEIAYCSNFIWSNLIFYIEIPI